MSNPSCESGDALRADTRGTYQDRDASLDDQIRVRAFERYMEKGKQPSDLRDWLEAERDYQKLLKITKQS